MTKIHFSTENCKRLANFALRNVLSTDLSMNPWLTVALLVVSNVFMTFAWYCLLYTSDAADEL